MLSKALSQIEKPFFRTLNKYLEPAIRAGFGSTGLAPVGAVVLETTGRKSGRTYKTPVLASQVRCFLTSLSDSIEEIPPGAVQARAWDWPSPGNW